MFQHLRTSIKGLGPKELKASCVIICVISLILSVSATSDCPSANSYPVTCKCDNGQTERHFTAESFKEAREDPKSCCYYNPKPVNEPIVYNIRVITPTERFKVTEVQIEPELAQIEEISTYRVESRLFRVDASKEIIEPSKELPKTAIIIRSLFELIFPPHLIDQFQISNPLFS